MVNRKFLIICLSAIAIVSISLVGYQKISLGNIEELLIASEKTSKELLIEVQEQQIIIERQQTYLELYKARIADIESKLKKNQE